MDFNASISIDDCNDHFANNLLFNTAVVSLFLCVGIIGNGQVLYLYKFKMPQTEERFFIPHLAVADLLSCVCLACLGLTMNNFYANFPNEMLCKLLDYFSWVTTSWSAFILLMISISRYLKICRPTGKQMTLFWKKCAVYGCLLFAIINTVPVPYFGGFRHQNVICLGANVTVVMCELREFNGTMHTLKVIYIFFEICVILFNAGLTASLYVPIGYQIYKRFKKLPTTSNQSNHGLRAEQTASIDKSETGSYEPMTMATNCLDETSNLNIEMQFDTVQNVEMENLNPTADSNPEMGSNEQPDDIQINKQTVIKKRYSTKRHTMSAQLSRHETNIKVRNNFTYMFITIIIFYLLSYLPTFIVILLATDEPFNYWYTMDILTLNVIMLLRRSSIINHIVNPLIYGYFDRVYRKFFMECFVCRND